MHSHISKILIVQLFLINMSTLAFANTYDSIEYNLDLALIKSSVLKVEVVLKGTIEDKLAMRLPFEWAGTRYNDQIKNIQIDPRFSIELKQEDTSSQAVISVPTLPCHSLKVTYEIHQKTGDPSDVHDAIVRDNLVHAPGYGIFATPLDLIENEKIKVTINWVNLPSSWKTLSSHTHEKTIRLNITPLELLHSIYVAGKMRLHNLGTQAQPIFLSLYGCFDLEDQNIASDISEVIYSQRAFFNDAHFPFYAISLIEGSKPRFSGGTRLVNSFTAFLPKGSNRNDYYLLFAHEHLHSWIGGKLGNGKDEELNYWWTEGFTDYYSKLIAFRSKGIDRKTFINEINQSLRAYYLSPVNQVPNSRIKEDFWNSYDIEKLPYYRGLVFALYLNNLIQKTTSNCSLDTIVLDLVRSAPTQPFSSSLFQEIVQQHVKKSIADELITFIEKGNLISLKDINLPTACDSIEHYDLGFNKDTVRKNQLIEEIDTKSNAYASGLRNGQQVIGDDIPEEIGDPNRMVTVRTTTGTFKFLPKSYKGIKVYQLKANLSPQEEKQFNQFFGIK